MSIRAWLAKISLVIVSATPSLAGEPPASEESLGRAVPSDVALYCHYSLEPDGALAAVLGQVVGTLSREGFFTALSGMIVDGMFPSASPKDGKAAVGGTPREHWLSLIAAVDWRSLFSREVVVAGRFRGEIRDYLVLFQVGREREAGVLDALRRLIYAACSAGPTLEITESWRDTEKAIVLQDTASGKSFCLAGRDGIVLAATAPNLLRHSLQLLVGEGSDLGYVYSTARAASLSRISVAPEALRRDGFEVQADVASLFPDFPSLAGLDSFVIAGRAAESEVAYSFEGRFSPGGGGGFLRRALLDRPALGAWRRAIPGGVRSFTVTSGPVPDAFREFLGQLAVDALADGEKTATAWGILESPEVPRPEPLLGLALDAASLTTGRCVVLADLSGFVVLLDLTEGEESGEKLVRLLTRLETRFRTLKWNVKGEKVEGLEGTFLSVSAPGDGSCGGSDPPEFRFVVGATKAAKECLAVATSVDLLRTAIATQREGAPALPAEEQDLSAGFPEGRLLRVTSAEPPLLVPLARLFLAAVRSLPEGSRDRSLAGLLARFAPALDALTFFRSESHAAARDGSLLRGRGRWVLRTGAETPHRKF